MDFTLSEDQTMIRDMLSRFIARRYGAGEQRACRAEPLGYSVDNLASLAELGLFSLPFPEKAGGLGGSLADLAMLMEGLGHGLVVEPVLSRVVIAARLLALAGSDEVCAAWHERAITGAASLALAHHERSGAGATVLDGGRLSGTKSFVLDAVGVDAWIVTCRDASRHFSPLMAVVAAGTPGVTVQPYRIADGSLAADVTFDGVEVTPANVCPYLTEAFDFAMAEAAVAAAAEMLGVMQRLLDDTVAFVQTREQFGQPIGKFQSVQHRAARMFIAVEQARSLVLKAALVGRDEAGWLPAVRSCCAFIAEAALDLAHDAVQLHGGIGITDELAVSFGHRRILVLRKLFAPGGPLALEPRLPKAA